MSILIFICLATALFFYACAGKRSVPLDWSKIDIQSEKLVFPKNFIWGVAASAYQSEGGDTTCNWYRWEQDRKPDGTSRIANNETCGESADHWTRFKEDIQLAKDLGINSFRISLSWSRIQPIASDSFDEAALAHYDEVIDEMKRQGIEPMICLYHFVHPQWFSELHEWEEKENNKYFVAFAQKVFARYADRVRFWFPFNEPNVTMAACYLSDMFPPGKVDSKLAGTVMCNILDAHVDVYKALKAMPHGAETQIGMIHNYSLLEPWQRFNPIDVLMANYGNKISNESILESFRTGKFSVNIPGVLKMNYNNPDIVNAYDFVGVNYYNRTGLHFRPFAKDRMKRAEMNRFPEDIPTDMDYGLYPEGLSVAIKEFAKLNKPMYITEIGLADDKGPNRALHIKRSYYLISKAIQEGYDIRGVYYWSLTDNFEWVLGFDKRFGLYHVDYKTQKRTLKPGAEELEKIIKSAEF